MMDLQTRLLYSVVMLASMIAALTLVQRQQGQLRLTTRQRAVLAFAAFLGAMVGAKLPFLVDKDWSGLVAPSLWLSDGKTILGGIFGGYLAVEIAKRIAGIRIKTGDSFALPIAVAVAIGRFGCYVAGCCFGCVTKLPWGVSFSLAKDQPGIIRHPTQLYECAFHVVCAMALLIGQHYRWFEGNRLKIYLLLYLGFRFLTEWIRPEPMTSVGLTSYQIACLMLASMLLLLWGFEHRSTMAGKVET
jgi:phosphatidylglycerol---prolipoprotein diacylglyceryl transferase